MNSQIHKYWNNLQGLNILISGTLLAFGLYLYLMYRPNNPYVIKAKAIFDISDKLFTTSHWIIYNLPDALWCGSGAILINALKKNKYLP